MSIDKLLYWIALAFWTLAAISGVIFLLETFGFSLEREVLATLIIGLLACIFALCLKVGRIQGKIGL